MKTRLQSAVRKLLASVLLFASVISPTLLTTGTTYAVTQDCDYGFYSSNDIVTYDPCAVACAPAGTDSISIEDSKDTAESIFKFFISTAFSTNNDKPLTAVQAAGFLGNFQAESGNDPSTKQHGGNGIGLAQWDSRRGALEAFAKSRGKDWSDLETQLLFIKKELEGSESAILKDSQFRSASLTPEEAALRVRIVYERPGEPHDDRRKAAARAFYDEFKDLAPGDVTYGSGGRCSLGAGNGDIVKTAELLAWPDRKPNGFFENKPEYQKALEATGVNKLGDSCSMGGNSCDAFVATVMRYSGLDTEFHCCLANAQRDYMAARSDKYQALGHITDTSQMQAGDIMWRDGHIKIYLGDGRQADASHCQRTASISPDTYFDGSYYAFRFIGSGTSPPDKTTE